MFSYSAALNACAKAGRAEDATGCFHRAVSAGMPLNPVLFSALIDAHGEVGQGRDALAVLRQMQPRYGVKPNVFNVNAVLRAMAIASQGPEAGTLLETMADEFAVPPNVYSVNAAIEACGRAGQWEAALQIFERYATANTHGVKLNHISVNAAVSACVRSGQWEAALTVLQPILTAATRDAVNDLRDPTLSAAALRGIWTSVLGSKYDTAVESDQQAERIACAVSSSIGNLF